MNQHHQRDRSTGSHHSEHERAGQASPEFVATVGRLRDMVSQGAGALQGSHIAVAEELLEQHIASRQMTATQFLPGTEIHKPYGEYTYSFNCDHSHIAKIIPGYEPPEEELMQRLAERGGETYGTIPATETGIILQMVKALKPRTSFEIGTNKGFLAREVMAAAQSAGANDLISFTLDLPPGRHNEFQVPLDGPNQDFIRHTDEELGMAFCDPEFQAGRQIIQLIGDSTQFDYSAFLGKMDVVIVDGNHVYEAVKNDLQVAQELVSPGGVILIDDVHKPFRLEGVTEALLGHIRTTGKVFYFANFGFGDHKIENSHLAFHVNVPEATRA